MNRIEQGIQHLKSSSVKPLPEINEALAKLNSAAFKQSHHALRSAETI